MKLMYDLPPADKSALDGAIGGDKLMYCVPFNVLDGKFVSGFIAISNKHIFKLFDGKVINTWTISEGKNFTTEVMYGSGAF